MKYAELIAECNPSQTPSEVDELLTVLEGTDVRTILEIGVHQGGSLRLWARALAPIDQAVGVNWGDEWVGDREGYDLLLDRRSQDPSTVEWVRSTIRRPVDFLFIDGGHTYDEVAEDYRLYEPLVRPGGAIAFHDVVIVDDVRRFWEELTASRASQTIWGGQTWNSGIGLIHKPLT